MNKKKLKLGLLYFILALTVVVFVSPGQKEQKMNGFKENRAVYRNDSADSVKEVFITVFPADKQSKKYSHTFKELNADEDWRDDVEIAVRVLFQEGKDGSPQKGFFGYGLTDANGVMELRGRSTRRDEQKSYRIKLKKDGGLWTGYETVNLNKHPYDAIKVRNKLSFDYLKSVPGITSLRTQFVHVYIKDYSQEDYNQDFKDFGLFTQVENMDTDFLKNHGLDAKGSLYKAENFEFFRYPDKLKLKTDDEYQEETFEEILGIGGSDDHAKLLGMLNDVNNKLNHINQTIAEHFDRDNYITWLAVNILLGNIDTNSQNYYLYSPRDSKTWYFLPWDFDGAWGFYDQDEYEKAPWQEGVSNYWGNVLHRRFFQNRANIIELNQKIESLRKIFTEKNTEKLLEAYQPVVTPFLTKSPDKQKEWPLHKIREEFARLPGLIEKNRQAYYQNIQKPMPVHMGRPVDLGKNYIFTWEHSYDFQGDLISYSVDVSNSPDFKAILRHREGIRDTQYVVKDLPPGKYYWRLKISDAGGNTGVPFDIYRDRDRKPYYGVQEFFAQ